MTRRRPSLDRLEGLLRAHSGECVARPGSAPCDACDLAAEVVAVHRLRAMLCDELEAVVLREKAAEPEGPAALRDPKELHSLPVVFLGPDVLVLVKAARVATCVLAPDADYENTRKVLLDALKPFEGIGEGE